MSRGVGIVVGVGISSFFPLPSYIEEFFLLTSFELTVNKLALRLSERKEYSVSTEYVISNNDKREIDYFYHIKV